MFLVKFTMLTSEPLDQKSFAAGWKDVCMDASYIEMGKKDECHQRLSFHVPVCLADGSLSSDTQSRRGWHIFHKDRKVWLYTL